METLKFKTNIKCGGCVAGVTPHLNQLATVQKWKVDIENPDKVLTIESDKGISAQEIIDTVELAGFKAEQL